MTTSTVRPRRVQLAAVASAVAVVSAVLTACAPSGDDSSSGSSGTTKLVVGGISPPDNPVSVSFKAYLDDLEEASDGSVEIQWHPGAELVPTPEALGALGDGVFDMLLSSGSAYAGTVPLGTWQDLPLFSESLQHTLDVIEQTDVVDIVDKEYQKSTNTKLLQMRVLSPYVMVMAKGHEIRSIADFKGEKIRSVGGAVTKFLEKVGAVPVELSPSDLYTGLQSGTVDGLVLPLYTLESYKLGELAGSVTNIGPGSVVSQYVWMNLDKYNSLPEKTKELLYTTTQEDGPAQVKFWSDVQTKSEDYADQYKMEIIDFDPAEAERLQELVKPLVGEFVDENGAAAAEVIDAYNSID